LALSPQQKAELYESLRVPLRWNLANSVVTRTRNWKPEAEWIRVPVEAIALLAGHNQTATTELVYRHQVVPALTRGAEVMDQIFG